MRLKPPGFLRRNTVRNTLAVGVAVAGISSLVLTQATPAFADPTQTLVLVGSDTIQDVWNAFGTTFGGNFVGSYNATNPVTGAINENITPVDGTAGVNCSFARPNGSGQGVAALRFSLNPASANVTGSIAPGQKPEPGCVDLARSSSGPGSLGNFTGSGAIQYVPFALDAVTGATGTANCATANPANCPAFNADLGNGSTKSVTPVVTNITQANLFTLADLTNLYANCQPVTEGGVTYWPAGSPVARPSGSTVIDLYVPQPGSGTRNFWGTTLGNFPTGAGLLPACVNDHIIGGALAPANDGGVSVPVEEHDGTAVATDPNGYGPFSIAQYISQSHGHSPRIHDAALQDVNGIAPETTSGTLNTSFPITRDVYDVVSLARLQNTSDPLFSLLNGSTSQVCSAKSTIVSFGFALLGASCGEIIPSLEAAP